MTEFLSDDWVLALDSRLVSSETGSSATPLVIQYDVSTRRGERTYHLTLGPNGDRATIGPADDPDIVFTMDEATAKALSRGELSTEEAFISGRLELTGDPTPLIEAYRNITDA